MKTSVGQAAVNALAAWIQSQVNPSDTAVFSRWPEAGSGPLPPRAISVIKVGKRERLDVSGVHFDAQVNLVPHGAQYTYVVGHVMQPCQIDLWDTTDVGRDDLVAQLDDILTAGDAPTLGTLAGNDTVSDGIVVPFLAADGFAGNVEVWMDEPETNDAPDAIQRSEYRATILGELRCAFTVQRVNPRMATITFTPTVT